MKTIKIDTGKITNDEFKVIAEYLIAGKTIAYPTDTVYGLGGDAFDRRVIGKVFRIKKRKRSNAMIVLVGSISMLKKYCFVSQAQEGYLKSVWECKSPRPPLSRGRNAVAPRAGCGLSPLDKGGLGDLLRPTTVILRSRGILPKELGGNSDSLAVRLPQAEWLRRLIKKVKRPLISTSLNLSGQPTLDDPSLINEYFKSPKPDLVIDGGKAKRRRPSRLVDLRMVGDIRVIRK